MHAMDAILETFKTADSDGDGSLSNEEFEQILKTIGIPDTDIPEIFKEADANCDGRVDYAEFIRWLMGGKAPAEQFHLPAEEPADGVAQLKNLVDQVFKCFDSESDDGQIDKDEYLSCWEKLAEILDESFGPKQRKVKMKWFKDAGAEGDPASGMYLEKEKWVEAYLKTAREDSGFGEKEPGKLAAWIWGMYAKRLIAQIFPAKKDDMKVEAQLYDPALGTPPTYPLTIPLTKLGEKLEEAKAFRLRPLILASGLDEVATFMKYQIQDHLTIDVGMAEKKDKKQLRDVLCEAMDHAQMCAAVHIKIGNNDIDWKNFCCDDFPAEMFSAARWTPDKALDMKFIDENMWSKVTEIDPVRWHKFTLVLTCDFNLEESTKTLSGQLPYYKELAIIVIDPDSVPK